MHWLSSDILLRPPSSTGWQMYDNRSVSLTSTIDAIPSPTTAQKHTQREREREREISNDSMGAAKCQCNSKHRRQIQLYTHSPMGVYPRGLEREQSLTFLKVGVDRLVISTNLLRLDRQIGLVAWKVKCALLCRIWEGGLPTHSGGLDAPVCIINRLL